MIVPFILWIAFTIVAFGLASGEIKHPGPEVYFGTIILLLGALITTFLPYVMDRMGRGAKPVGDAPTGPGIKKPPAKTATKPLAN